MQQRILSSWLFVLALLLASNTTSTCADIIASSRVQACTRDGSQASQQLQCAQKLVVTLSVDSGDTVASSDLQLSLSCVNSSTGSCPCACDYLTDPGCTCRDLKQQVSIQLTKSPLWASYPLTYLQSFNYKPYENILYVQSGTCKDGALESNPTCGWYMLSGQRQADSQGFCCDCTLSSIFDDTFGSASQKSRAGLNCDFFNNPLGGIVGRYPSSASCLEFDVQWYGGYAMGEAMFDFSIQAQVVSSDPTTNITSNEVVTVSPSVPVATASSATLTAKLLGDLAGYTQLPVLSPKLLMIPRPRAGQTLPDVLNNRTNWMLVDRSLISFDGTQCDRVGTSFMAFKYHTDRCKRAPQTCLSNQLKDLHQSDLQRIAQGRTPQYLVSQYTYGLQGGLKQAQAGAFTFALPVPFKRSSIVVLEAAADGLQFVTNVSPGRLSGARICQFSGAVCGGFEATSARGYIHANVTNTGTLPAAYTLSVTNCSANIRPVEAQALGLKPGATMSILPFEIYVEDDSAQTDRSCWLVLFDAEARRVDSVQVEFYTNTTVYDETPILVGGTNTTSSPPQDKTARDCSTCGRTQFTCLVRNRCWSKFGGMVGWMGGGLLGLLLLALVIMKAGLLGKLLAGCARLCGGGTKSEHYSHFISAPGAIPAATPYMVSSTGQLLLAGMTTSSMSGSAPGQMVSMAPPPYPAFDSAPVFDWGGGQLQKMSKKVELGGSQEGRGSTGGGLLAAVWGGAGDGGRAADLQQRITSHQVELLDLASTDGDASNHSSSAADSRQPASKEGATAAASGSISPGTSVRAKQGGLPSASSGSIPSTPSAGQQQPVTQLAGGDDSAFGADANHAMPSSSQQQVYRRSASGLRLRRTISSNAGGEGAVAPSSPVGLGSGPASSTAALCLRQPPSPIGSLPSSPSSV